MKVDDTVSSSSYTGNNLLGSQGILVTYEVKRSGLAEYKTVSASDANFIKMESPTITKVEYAEVSSSCVCLLIVGCRLFYISREIKMSPLFLSQVQLQWNDIRVEMNL